MHRATVEPPEITANPDLKFTAWRFTSDGGAKDVQTPGSGPTDRTFLSGQACSYKDEVGSGRDVPRRVGRYDEQNLGIGQIIEDAFRIGADYDVDMVKAQIEAVREALAEQYVGFMVWNPLNRYTAEALPRVTG